MMTATEQAITALRAAASFADHVAEAPDDEDVIWLHRQCTEAIAALRAEIEREASTEQQMERAAA